MVVVFSIHSVPDHQELEKKYSVPEMKKIIEKQLPACLDCSGKLAYSDLYASGFPRKCPHCGFASEKISQKIFSIGKSQLVEKEMTLLG